MSSFTLFLLIFVIVAAFFGWRSGLTKQIGQVAGIILGIAACRIFGVTAAAMLCGENPSGTDKVLYTVLAYVVLFIVVYLAVSLVMTVVRKLLHAIFLGFVDRIGGAVFRVVEWLLLLSLALNLWVALVPDTTMVEDPVFAQVVWFAPYLMGTETALKLGSVVGTAVHG